MGEQGLKIIFTPEVDAIPNNSMPLRSSPALSYIYTDVN